MLSITCAGWLVCHWGDHRGRRARGGGSGFPPGFHYNLNLIGKKTVAPGVFSCPSTDKYQYEWWKEDTGNADGITCLPLSGTGCAKCDRDDPVEGASCSQGAPKDRNVVFVPRQSNDRVTIEIQSGSKRTCPDFNQDGICDLEVTDWCTESFPDYLANNGDKATISLPNNPNGYDVYARLVGKPKRTTGKNACQDDPSTPQNECVSSMTLFSGLESVLRCFNANLNGVCNPEEQEQLLTLGFFDKNGVHVYRTDPSGTTQGKGVRKAINISGLFQFTGHVCLNPTEYLVTDAGMGCQVIDWTAFTAAAVLLR